MLVDSFDRTFSYLRLSVTEKCNFRCSYCLPNGYKHEPTTPQFLTLDEIRNLSLAFQRLGVTKIRLTGGEPTLRPDIIEIVRALKDIGIESVAMTTNGFRLGQLLPDLKKAGLDALNLSLDSLNEKTFADICGSKRGSEIKSHVDTALSLGFKKVKVNCVLLKGVNDLELSDFLRFVADREISLRFIELMRTGGNKEFFEQHHLNSGMLERSLRAMGWCPSQGENNSGPAREFYHPGSLGKIGFISPYSEDFCKACNRLRVSSRGGLRLCLFGEGEISLRALLQKNSDSDQLQALICKSLRVKPKGHRLHENIYGMTNALSAIGG